MVAPPRSLLRLAAMLTLAAAASAQATYYVNGGTGLDAASHGGSPAMPWS